MSNDVAIQYLARVFPSMQSMPPDQARQHTEDLGCYAARLWVGGHAALRERGVDLPDAAFQAMASLAPRVVEANQNGLPFLNHLAKACGDPATYGNALKGLGIAFAEARRQGTVDAPVAAEAPPAAAAAPTPVTLTAPAAPPPPASDDLDLAPEGAQLQAPRPAAPPPPASGGGSDFGDLDLAPEGAGLGAAPPARAPEPAPSSGGADFGDLDLMPEDDPPERPADDYYDLMADAPPAPAPAAADSGGLEVDEFSLGEDDQAPAAAAAAPDDGRQPGEALWAQQAKRAPSDPGQAAIHRFETQGDPRALEEAKAHFTRALESAPHATAAAVLEAELGRVALLRGDAQTATQHAQKSQARDPSCPGAAEVLIRADRGDADDAAFHAALARVRGAVEERNFAQAKPLADQFAQAFSHEPHPFLILAFMGRLAGQEALFQSSLKTAWENYPSGGRVHVPLGGALDADVSESLIGWGREVFKGNDAEALAKTVEDVDDKDNLIAGSLRMGVGVARVAWSTQPRSQTVRRRLAFSIARGLVGLQYYDGALPWLGAATGLGPAGGEAKAIGDERINAGALRRAFDRPGIKAQLKAYKCLGGLALAQTLKTRLEQIQADQSQRQEVVFAKGVELIEKGLEDATLKREITRGAKTADHEDPFTPIDAADAELAAIEQERAEIDQERQSNPKGGGLFGKLKAAAGAAGAAASGAKLKFKENQARSRRQAAVQSAGQYLAEECTDAPWRTPELIQFRRQAAILEAFVDAYATEAARLQKQIPLLTQDP